MATPTKLIPGTRWEVNEHGNPAWDCPRCHLWMEPIRTRCWSCGTPPRADLPAWDYSIPEQRDAAMRQMQEQTRRALLPHRAVFMVRTVTTQRYAPLVGRGEIRYGLTRHEPKDNDTVYIRKSPDSQWAITRLRAAFIHALKVRPREV